MGRLSLVAVVLLCGTALARGQDRNWSGTWAGVTGGVGASRVADQFITDTFCLTRSVGAGSADCFSDADETRAFAVAPGANEGGAFGQTQAIFDATSLAAYSSSAAGVSGSVQSEPQYVDIVTGVSDPVAHVYSNANVSGTDPDVFSNGLAGAYVDTPGQRSYAFAAAETGENGTITSQAFAMALTNVLDLASEGDQRSWLLGGKLHADTELSNGVVVGLGANLALGFGQGELLSRQTVDFSDTDTLGIDLTTSVRPQALASAVGRLGYDFGNLMPYLTGGLAVGYFQADSTLAFDLPRSGTEIVGELLYNSERQSSLAIGGVVGAGLSFFLSDDIVVGAEMSHYVFDHDFTVAGANTVIVSGHTNVSAGISFRL